MLRFLPHLFIRSREREREMKIQCNACETAEANVLCCADEAALCWDCDEKIHAANKLASKHQRVPLTPASSHMPKCDICQESVGYFFCLEDRALLCRKCDVRIHSASTYASSHRRFLLTGVRVGLEATEAVTSSTKEKSNNSEKTAETQLPMSRKGVPLSISKENERALSRQGGGTRGLPVTKVSFASGTTMSEIMPEWPLEAFFGVTGLNQNYGFIEQGSFKADHGKVEDSEWSPAYRPSTDDGADVDECSNQAIEIPRAVPEIPSAPTASSLCWPRDFRIQSGDCSMFVPDLGYSCLQNLQRDQMNPSPSQELKRRRHC